MKYNEMRAGDRVEITDKRTVTISKVDEAQNAFDEQGSLILANGPTVPSTREFGLIERPIPEIPTKLGSIISVQGENPFNGPDEFILIKGIYVDKTWRGIGKSGAKNASEMAKFVNDHGGFEVVR